VKISYIGENKMWGVDEIKSYLKDNLKPSRYGHTLGVVKTAIELAEIYNEDKQKAEIAALCHDIAKNMSYEDMLKVIEEENLKLSNDEKNSKELWHSIIAPIMAKRIFEIEDEDVLNAMRWHTTGRENMSNLEKIIYLADLIEPSRNFQGIEAIRDISRKNLNDAVLKALTHTIMYLLTKDCAVDLNSIKARNYLIYNS